MEVSGGGQCIPTVSFASASDVSDLAKDVARVNTDLGVNSARITDSKKDVASLTANTEKISSRVAVLEAAAKAAEEAAAAEDDDDADEEGPVVGMAGV